MNFLFGVIEDIPKIPLSNPMPNAKKKSLGDAVTWHGQNVRTIQSMGKPLLHSFEIMEKHNGGDNGRF